MCMCMFVCVHVYARADKLAHALMCTRLHAHAYVLAYLHVWMCTCEVAAHGGPGHAPAALPFAPGPASGLAGPAALASFMGTCAGGCTEDTGWVHRGHRVGAQRTQGGCAEDTGWVRRGHRLLHLCTARKCKSFELRRKALASACAGAAVNVRAPLHMCGRRCSCAQVRA